MIITLAGKSDSTVDAAIAKRPALNRADCHLGSEPKDILTAEIHNIIDIVPGSTVILWRLMTADGSLVPKLFHSRPPRGEAQACLIDECFVAGILLPESSVFLKIPLDTPLCGFKPMTESI